MIYRLLGTKMTFKKIKAVSGNVYFQPLTDSKGMCLSMSDQAWLPIEGFNLDLYEVV